MSGPRIICVLGMHRSGTSLTTRVLHLLGLHLGPEEHLIEPSSANPTGYWESTPIRAINDEILERLGGSWSEPPRLTPGWAGMPELAEPRRQARDLIEADFSGSDLWGFKDPRTCLTLPFWQRILGPMRYVICLRNPLDVATSLAARKTDAVPFEEGVGLWLTYVRASLAATAGHRRQVVFYEDLMADPQTSIARLARIMGKRAVKAVPDARSALRDAMSEGLWHHRTTPANVVDATALSFPVRAFYLAMRQYVSGPEEVGMEVLDTLGRSAGDADRDLAWLEEAREQLRTAQAEQDRLEHELAERDAELAERDAELAEREAEQNRLSEGHALELAERDAELTRLRAEEQRLRRQLERGSPREGSSVDQRDGLPHPPPAGYARLVNEVRERARELIPAGATTLVASKGDDALLQLGEARGWHFPVASDGRYVGYHPAGDTAVIAQLEALRARGADHLLLPATTLWWLEHYQGFRRHLENRYEALLEDETCAIYRLRPPSNGETTGGVGTVMRTVTGLRMSGCDPSILDWKTGFEIADHIPDASVFIPPDDDAQLPYLSGTVDVVVVAGADEARLAEARRVAAGAVVRIDPGTGEAELHWAAKGLGGWGKDVAVTIVPSSETSPWEASLRTVTETVDEGFGGEISVVGDASMLAWASERTAGSSAVRLIEVPVGTSLSQRARMAAEGGDREVQIFVAAPAVPLPDWLPSVLALFAPARDAGVVGARILSRSGALQEAGGEVATGGARRRRGEGDLDPDRPEYCFVRRVDFCSPPLLATRREVFERLSGFDETATRSSAFVDFSLRAGRSGASVYYQPQARLVSIGEEGE